MNADGFEQLLYQDQRIALGKAALLCCMIDNEHDSGLVAWLAGKGVRAVITRAGGTGDNLRSKILKNTYGAAENSGLLAPTPRNRHGLTRLVEDLMRGFDTPLLAIAGAGLKIGIAVQAADVAMAIYGKLGIPGMNVDLEVAGSRVLNHYLEA